jgi:hypothetical protein
VQGWSADAVTKDDGAYRDDDDAYQSVACLACTRVHLINLKTGKVLGAKEDWNATPPLQRFALDFITPLALAPSPCGISEGIKVRSPFCSRLWFRSIPYETDWIVAADEQPTSMNPRKVNAFTN